jgi:hypothetical protein
VKGCSTKPGNKNAKLGSFQRPLKAQGLMKRWAGIPVRLCTGMFEYFSYLVLHNFLGCPIEPTPNLILACFASGERKQEVF